MRILFVLSIALFSVSVYGQMNIEDVENLKMLGSSEKEILQEAKTRGFSLSSKEDYFRLQKLGFSREFIRKLIHLSSKSTKNGEFSNLVDRLRKSYNEQLTDESTKKIWALAMGINHYQDVKTLPKLTYAEADAEGFAKHLLSIGVPPDQICLLVGKEVTRSNIAKKAEQLLQSNGTIYVFYSGHGLYLEQPGFLLTCYDTDVRKLADTSYPIDLLKRQLKTMRGDRALLFIDACHSGASKGAVVEFTEEEGGGELQVGREISKQAQNTLKQIDTTKPVLLITSCQANQTSQEGSGNGIFTQSMLAALSGEADTDKNGKITMGEMLSFIKGDVARRTTYTQDPDHSFSRGWDWQDGYALRIPGAKTQVTPKPQPDQDPKRPEPKPEPQPKPKPRPEPKPKPRPEPKPKPDLDDRLELYDTANYAIHFPKGWIRQQQMTTTGGQILVFRSYDGQCEVGLQFENNQQLRYELQTYGERACLSTYVAIRKAAPLGPAYFNYMLQREGFTRFQGNLAYELVFDALRSDGVPVHSQMYFFFSRGSCFMVGFLAPKHLWQSLARDFEQIQKNFRAK